MLNTGSSMPSRQNLNGGVVITSGHTSKIRIEPPKKKKNKKKEKENKRKTLPDN